MPFYLAALLYLAVLMPFSHVHADSTVFSQFIGATTASRPSSDGLAADFTICTNYIHGLAALTAFASSLSTQVEQEYVDGVCELCTSLGQTRVDSCCAQATSSACFDQFAGSNAVQTTPASVSATPTATLVGGSTSTPSSSSNGGVIVKNNLDLLAGSFVAAMIGFAGWIL